MTTVKYNDIMVDIETLSTEPNAVILSLGAIKFSRDNKPVPALSEMETFYKRINIDSCKDLGMHVDPETVKWWDKQEESVKNEALGNEEGRESIQETLNQFSSWIGTNPSIKIWGNGDDFDCVILTQAYKSIGLIPPWKFWNTRDVRTVFDMGSIHPWELPNDNKHHPIDDCYRQIFGLKKAFKILGYSR